MNSPNEDAESISCCIVRKNSIRAAAAAAAVNLEPSTNLISRLDRSYLNAFATAAAAANSGVCSLGRALNLAKAAAKLEL